MILEYGLNLESEFAKRRTKQKLMPPCFWFYHPWLDLGCYLYVWMCLNWFAHLQRKADDWASLGCASEVQETDWLPLDYSLLCDAEKNSPPKGLGAVSVLYVYLRLDWVHICNWFYQLTEEVIWNVIQVGFLFLVSQVLVWSCTFF